METSSDLNSVRDALSLVRDAIHRADDYGKRDLWRIEGHLCRTAMDVSRSAIRAQNDAAEKIREGFGV